MPAALKTQSSKSEAHLPHSDFSSGYKSECLGSCLLLSGIFAGFGTFLCCGVCYCFILDSVVVRFIWYTSFETCLWEIVAGLSFWIDFGTCAWNTALEFDFRNIRVLGELSVSENRSAISAL